MTLSEISPEPIALPLSPPMPGLEGFVTGYLLRGEKMALIDPGPKACVPQLLSLLGDINVKPEALDYILLSHIHIDHAGGLGELMRHAVKARAVLHPQGVRHMVSPERLWQRSLSALGEMAEKYGAIDPVPEARVVPAEDGMEIALGGWRLRVVFSPGHASHHISFWDQGRSELYIGEAAGVYNLTVDAVRPATASPFDLTMTLDSLAKLSSLNPKIICYSHGGCVLAERDTLNRYRTQLLCWRDSITSARSREPEAIFKVLLGEDEELRRLRALEKAAFERERFFILNSISGFLSYLKIT